MILGNTVQLLDITHHWHEYRSVNLNRVYHHPSTVFNRYLAKTAKLRRIPDTIVRHFVDFRENINFCFIYYRDLTKISKSSIAQDGLGIGKKNLTGRLIPQKFHELVSYIFLIYV
jgi:hypothetical protein